MLSTMGRTRMVSGTGRLVRPYIARSIMGGFVGTGAITLMMYVAAPVMMGRTMDIAQMLGSMLGDHWWAGMTMHFVNGTILFPLIFAVFLSKRLPGVPAVNGMIWGVVLWFLAQAVMMPMMGAGFFSAHTGGMMAVMGSLMGHLAYGGLLGAIAGSPK